MSSIGNPPFPVYNWPQTYSTQIAGPLTPAIWDQAIWDDFYWNINILTAQQTYPLVQWTGSNNIEPICFVEGHQASADYAVPLRFFNGPCPHCQGPLDETLAFNPLSGNYFISCPICLTWIRYCNIWGTIGDFSIVHSLKQTPLDQDLNVEDRYDNF